VDINKYSVKQYYQMWERGDFDNQRVELIEGEITNKLLLTPLEATGICLIEKCLRKTFGSEFVYSTRVPLSLGKFSEPEVYVTKGKIRDFIKSHPKTAELLVEVSEQTLDYFRNRKASLYAKNKIKDDTMFYGFGYAERLILTKEDKVSPLVKSDVEIAVADLLP
jgi:hypothetical protein